MKITTFSYKCTYRNPTYGRESEIPHTRKVLREKGKMRYRWHSVLRMRKRKRKRIRIKNRIRKRIRIRMALGGFKEEEGRSLAG